MEKRNVFLGGTCNDSTWREQLIPMLEQYNISYFNPVVDNWTESCIIEENWHKEHDDYNLFVITKEMTGVFSIAEVVDLSNKRPFNTIFYVDKHGFNKGQLKSLNATIDIVKNNNAIICNSLTEIADFLNDKFNNESDIDIYEYENIIEIKPDSENQEIPVEYNNYTIPTIFLAGTIDMGNSIDWQHNFCKFMDNHNKKCVIFNPRRIAAPDDVVSQIKWELKHLEETDFIIMHILGTSKSPITLIELGLFAKTGKLIVICEDNFYRYTNVKVTCEYYNVPLYNNLEKYLNENIKKNNR